MNRVLAAVWETRRWRGWPLTGVAVAVLLGAMLRLVWVNDIEYKLDEAWLFEHARQVHSWNDLSWLGIPASIGMPNPGMSLWVFVGLSKLFAVEDPTGLARSVQVCNIAALVLLVAFAYRFVKAEEREPWLWAAALAAVNPLAVLLHRKIWPPSVLPLLTVFFLAGWWRRDRRGGAFLWGLLGPIMGQIHMSGFFFAAGFALWALLFDRKRVAWLGWLAGSALASLPLLPWLWVVATNPMERPVNPDRWVHAFELKFWTRWTLEAFGLGIDYTLEKQFREFLACPYVLGRPTYLVAALHVVLLAAAVAILGRLAVRLWNDRGSWLSRWVGRDCPSAFTQNAAYWGFGMLLTLSCFSIHRHYMVILFPLEFLWLARLALGDYAKPGRAVWWGRGLLATLWAAQVLISIGFLDYIHVRQRIDGEYGTAYGALTADELAGLKAGAPAGEPRGDRP